MKNPEIQQLYMVPQPILFMYASRANMNPNDFLMKLNLQHSDLDEIRDGYILSRKQHAAMLYKAGIKKSDQVLTEAQEDFLTRINTSSLIEELEKRTRN